MRAFLREPSTPWIVFDRDGRPPSHLAVGELLPAGRVSVMSSPQFFPPGSPSIATTEPSSLAVAADYAASPVAEPELPAPNGGRLLKAGALLAGMLSVLGVAAFALGDVQNTHVSASGAAMPAEVAPPDLDPKLPTQATDAPAPPAAPAPAKVDDPRMKLGRLSIAGAASSRDVFLDGKRLLGRGARSFVVTCGTHTISVGTRDGAEAVDVPCNAELLVAR